MQTPAHGSPALSCQQCGSQLPQDAPQELCPRCLLLLGAEFCLPNQTDAMDPGTACFVSATERHFGGYELFEEIGRGGMGVVYRARQVSLNREVAVKMLLFGEFASDEFIARFKAEAEAAASLRHPNIVAIHETGVYEGAPFFSMDLITGPNLAHLVREKPLGSRQAARYVRIIAEAISYAHDRGVLHRDLKPSNVLIDSDDEPHVTDFGLARRYGVKSLDRPKDILDDLTLPGEASGTPNYIPPEQAAGVNDRLGPQSDIYSLGALLYHLLTGRPPFAAESISETLAQVLQNEPVAPRRLNSSVPRDLETICLKCLQKNPARRYATAQELADDLAR